MVGSAAMQPRGADVWWGPHVSSTPWGQVGSAQPAALELTVQGLVWMREIVSEVGLVAQIEVPAGAIA